MKRLYHVYMCLAVCLLMCTPSLQAKEKTFTVVIDAGHGGKDPGAKGALVNEKEINLAVAQKLGDLIVAGHNDVRVIYTRKTDKFVELNERANIANRNKADLFISIHTNSLKKGKSVKGAETYTLGLAKTEENLEVAKMENSVILLEDNYLQRYEGFDPNSSESYIIFEFMQSKHVEQSVSFASEIQKEFASYKRMNRGVRQAGFLVLKATSMPSVLVELGFISNREEERYMRSAEGQNKLAQAIYEAFSRYKRDYVRKKGGVVDDGKKEEAVKAQKEPEKKTPEAPKKTAPEKQTTSQPAKATAKPVTAPAPKVEAPAGKLATVPSNNAGKIVYKIQILTSDKQLPLDAPTFKGYKVSCYQDGNFYKYTYGESTDMKEIQRIQKDLSKDFQGTFIIRTKDGKRLK